MLLQVVVLVMQVCDLLTQHFALVLQQHFALSFVVQLPSQIVVFFDIVGGGLLLLLEKCDLIEQLLGVRIQFRADHTRLHFGRVALRLLSSFVLSLLQLGLQLEVQLIESDDFGFQFGHSRRAVDVWQFLPIEQVSLRAQVFHLLLQGFHLCAQVFDNFFLLVGFGLRILSSRALNK